MRYELHPDFEQRYGGVDKEALQYEKLLYRVLERSFLDLTLMGDKESRRDARGYFFSNSKEPFSFYWICEYLNLDPKKLLSGCRVLFVRSFELDEKPVPEFLASPTTYAFWLS